MARIPAARVKATPSRPPARTPAARVAAEPRSGLPMGDPEPSFDDAPPLRMQVPMAEKNADPFADEGTRFERPGPATMAARQARTPSRDPGGRADELRSRFEVDTRGVLHIDPRDIPRGWSVEWKAETVLGARNSENIRMNMRNGWTPVLATEMPKYASPVLPGDTEADTLIRCGGQLLMKRPLDYTEAAIAAQRDATAFDIASLDRSHRDAVQGDRKHFVPMSKQEDGFVSRAGTAGRFSDA